MTSLMSSPGDSEAGSGQTQLPLDVTAHKQRASLCVSQNPVAPCSGWGESFTIGIQAPTTPSESTQYGCSRKQVTKTTPVTA